ncbi:MAG TPA: rhodanese-like domain-containing protein [Thermoanaerobaculia bacterium]|jgi:rhodanese-related sulfurtransferase|nr:rhodanese-like domain-containing protein [Thermoanaerobaculia bacterium]
MDNPPASPGPDRRLRASLVLALLLAVLATTGGCRWMRNRERPPYRKVTPAVAFEIMRDTPDLPILDLRPAAEFVGNTGHLRNARNIPLSRLPFQLIELGAVRDETMLVYCGTQECAEEGMAVLTSSGFENAVLMDGGIDAWIQQGFKTQLPSGKTGQLGQTARDLRQLPSDPTAATDTPAQAPPSSPPL